MKKSKVRKIVDEILSTQTSVYFGCREPRWIRQKTDAKAGDTVTVNGIKQRWIDKPPYPHYEEGYGIISGKRVYNGMLLCFDGERWINIAGGRNDKRLRRRSSPKSKRQHEINTGIPSNGLLPRRNVMEQKTITIFGSGSLSATDKANIISPKHYSWTPSEKEVPNDNRTVFIVKDRCHFIGFYEGKKFWLSSQNGVPINKRLKRTEIKQPLHWIDYPEDNSP